MKSLLLPCPAREGEVAFAKQMTEGMRCRYQSAPKFETFESPQPASLPAPLVPKGSLGRRFNRELIWI